MKAVLLGALDNFCSHQSCCLNEGLTFLSFKIFYFPMSSIFKKEKRRVSLKVKNSKIRGSKVWPLGQICLTVEILLEHSLCVCVLTYCLCVCFNVLSACFCAIVTELNNWQTLYGHKV